MDTATATLTEVNALRQRVRNRAHGGAWFPATSVSAFMLAGIALYNQPFVMEPSALSIGLPAWAGLPDEQRDPLASYLFWFIGTPILVGIVGWWYRFRARRSGLRVAWKWFAVAALGALALLALLAAVPSTRSLDGVPESGPLASLHHSARWLSAFFTPLIAVALAVIALGQVERSRWLTFAGLWIGFLTWWQGMYSMGGLPPWATWVLGGFEGGTLGGQWTLFGLHRPGPLLILMVLPLTVFAAARAIKAARALQPARVSNAAHPAPETGRE